MSKTNHALVLVVATIVALGSPLASHVANAATLTAATQTGKLPKSSAADKVKFEASVKLANMAFEKSKGDKSFIAAVKAKDAALVKRILIKNGADSSISKVVFEGPSAGSAERIKITISGSYPPPTLTITIKF